MAKKARSSPDRCSQLSCSIKQKRSSLLLSTTEGVDLVGHGGWGERRILFCQFFFTRSTH